MLFFYDGNEKAHGIYEIRNRISNKSYIGQTITKKGFKGRSEEHYNRLLGNRKTNKHLKNSYNFHKELLGHDNFLEFHILEIIENPTFIILNERETFWIEEYEKEGYILYNVDKNPNQPERTCWSHTPEESSKLRSERMKGKKLSEKTREKMKESHPRVSGEEHWLYGTKFSEERKEKISEGMTGEKNHFFGKKHSEESKEKISLNSAMKNKTGMKHQNSKVYSNFKLLSPTGEVFTEIYCLADFSRKYNLDDSKIGYVLNGKQSHHRGWRLLNENEEKIFKIINHMSTHEDIIASKRFQDILKQIPEEQRESVEKAIREMAKNFEEKVLKPLEGILGNQAKK